MQHKVVYVETQTGASKHLLLRVFCRCALLIESAKAGRIGNCKRVNLIGVVPSSFEERGIRGMRTILSVNDPAMIFASMTYSPSFVICNRVPLQIPLFAEMLRRRMMGCPTFSVMVY